MTNFWYAICDLKVIFEYPVAVHQSLESLVQAVEAKMKEFGNFAKYAIPQKCGLLLIILAAITPNRIIWVCPYFRLPITCKCSIHFQIKTFRR